MATVVVPDLTGMLPDDAKRAAAAAGLGLSTFGPSNPTSDTKLIGRVGSTNPPAGTVRPKNSLVTVRLYGPQPSVAVPDVTGKPPQVAAALLEARGLKMKSQQTPSSDAVVVGRAIRQDPPAGASVPRESSITVFVAVGVKQVAIPNIVGMSREEAFRSLRSAGLVPGGTAKATARSAPSHLATIYDNLESVVTTEPKNVNQVADQSPVAGTQVAEGSMVTMRVYKLDLVDVPVVLGLPRDDARSRLQQAGFTVDLHDEKAPKAELVGKVVGASPSHGQAPRGSRVAISVGVQ